MLFCAPKMFIPRSAPQVTSCTELLNIHGTIFNLSQHWSLEGRYAVKALKHMEPQVKQALQNLPKAVSSFFISCIFLFKTLLGGIITDCCLCIPLLCFLLYFVSNN